MGVLGGLTTLSGDAGTALNATAPTVSLYNPSNGPVVSVFGGRHWNNYLSFQGDYFWNRNGLTLVGLGVGSGGAVRVYERNYSSRQHAVSGNVLLYFRPRASKVRPYLSVGAGLVHLAADPLAGGLASGVIAPGRFQATRPTMPVAVGIDLKIRNGWAFRYSFSETISRNPISAQLSPPGTHLLMTFRNLFGFVKTF